MRAETMRKPLGERCRGRPFQAAEKAGEATARPFMLSEPVASSSSDCQAALDARLQRVGLPSPPTMLTLTTPASSGGTGADARSISACLADVLEILHARTGVNFATYRRAMLERRASPVTSRRAERRVLRTTSAICKARPARRFDCWRASPSR